MQSIALDWLHIIALLGALQGIFLAGVLITKKQNQTANRVLAAMTFTFTISLLTAVYHSARLERAFPHFFGVGYPLPLLFGPLVYLYAVTASDRTRQFTRRDALHFLPFAIVVFWGMPIYLQSAAGKIAFYESLLRGESTLLMQIADPLKMVSGVAYTVATLLFLRRHRDRVKASYSHLEHVNLLWLVWLGLSAAAIWTFAVVVNVLQTTGMQFPRADDFIALGIAVIVYGIGYMGLRQPEIFRFEASDPSPPAPPAEASRYERSGLSESEASALRDALLAVMESKRPWQDSELTLADLAGMVSTTPHRVSEVLNSRIGQTFYDFVNAYRVREVQRRMAKDKATLLALAFDAGFASKSTFNDVFKKHTGKTPSEYRRAAVQ
jgi:AraC-like DNA-binding protein